MAKAELEVGLRFEGAVVRPGDTLILVTRDGITEAWRDQVKVECREYISADIKVAVIEGIDQALVYRPGAGRFDRDALIDRWAENFGLNLASPVEAALAQQEADHVEALVGRPDAA